MFSPPSGDETPRRRSRTPPRPCRAEPPRNSAPPGAWARQLMGLVLPHRQAAGMTTQVRALRYDTGFTGLGTQSLVFRATGLLAEHRCSADPKPASKAFLARNGLMGRHHYDCVSSIGRPRGARVVCSTCPGECAAGPDDRPDMFAGGFPCQPWSLQRQACMRDVPPHEHPLYRCLTETIAYLRRVRPRAFLLENVHGFWLGASTQLASSRGQHSSRASSGRTITSPGLSWIRSRGYVGRDPASGSSASTRTRGRKPW